MKRVYAKEEKGVFVPIFVPIFLAPLEELKKIVTNFEIRTTGERVEITDENYEELFDRDLKKCKKASISDFVNI